MEYPLLKSLVINRCYISPEVLRLIAGSCPHLEKLETNDLVTFGMGDVLCYSYMKNIFLDLTNFKDQNYEEDYDSDFSISSDSSAPNSDVGEYWSDSS